MRLYTKTRHRLVSTAFKDDKYKIYYVIAIRPRRSGNPRIKNTELNITIEEFITGLPRNYEYIISRNDDKLSYDLC